MENKSYMKGVFEGIQSLATGMKVTFKEFFTPKVTEQYPENRKTLNISPRHHAKLVMPHDENGKNKCIACTMCEKACPNGSITIKSELLTDPATGRKKRILTEYDYDLGSCMFCLLCVNACPHDAIHFCNDFENSVFDRSKLVLRLNKPVDIESLRAASKVAEAKIAKEKAEKAKAAVEAKAKAEAEKKAAEAKTAKTASTTKDTTATTTATEAPKASEATKPDSNKTEK